MEWLQEALESMPEEVWREFYVGYVDLKKNLQSTFL